MQCWPYMYSIRGQIIMSHYFHIKKKSIIISIVLVKFLTIVRWMYKIPSEREREREMPWKYEHNEPARTWHAVHRGNCSLASSRQRNSLNQHTQSLGDQWLQFALASIFPSWAVCCVFTDCGFYIINICFYLATFVRFYLSSVPLSAYIQFNMELRYILILAKTRKTKLESCRPRALILDNSWAKNANLSQLLYRDAA